MPTPTSSNEQFTSPEAREAVRSPHAMTSAIEGVEHALGQYVPLPENLSEMDVKRMREQLVDPTTFVYDDFRDVSRLAEAMARMKAGQLEKFNQGDPGNIREWVLANRQITFNQYLPTVIEQLTGAMRLFESDLHDMLLLLPANERADMLAERDRTVLYLQHIQTLLEERTKLAALYEVTMKLVAAKGGAEVYTKEIPALQARKAALLVGLRPSAAAAFEAYEKGSLAYEAESDATKKATIRTQVAEAYNKYVLSTENELIETIKGNPDGKDIPSAPKDFLPQRAYITLLQARYTQIQKIQIDIANSTQQPEAIKAAQAELGALRRDAMDRLFALTQHLEAHHVSAAELSALQGMFEHGVDPEAHISIPYDVTSPDYVHNVATNIFEGTRTEAGANDFHLQRLEAMVTTADTAFSPKGLEFLTEEGAMQAITNIDQLSGSIRSLMTLKGIVPENEATKSMNTWFDEVFPLYLAESLDSGVTADGKPATKEEKLQRVQAVVLRFRDGGSVAAMKKTLELLRTLPKSADAIGERVQPEVLNVLGSQRFDTSPLGQNVHINGVEVTVNTATAYALLHGQLRSDSNTFQSSYNDFLGEMDRLVDLRLGLIADRNIVQANWGKLSMILGGSSLVLYGGALAAPYVLSKTPGWAVDGVKAGYRLSTSRLAPFVAIQGARTYLDYQEWSEQAERVRSDRMRMIGELRASGFQEDHDAGEDMYTYEHDGVKCTVSVREFESVMDGKTNAAGVRFAASATELAYLVNAARLSAKVGGRMVARAVPTLFMVEVAVETYQYHANQIANRQFLAKCPPWLVAKLASKSVQVDVGQEKIQERSSLQQSIGNTPYELLSTTSEAMLTDGMTHDPEANKRDIRTKMVFAILHDELREFPELREELYPGGMSALSMDEFFKGDFEDVFLKVFHARVYKAAKGNVLWDQAKDSRISGNSYIPSIPTVGLRGETPDTSEVDVRSAIREAIAVTVAHMKEKRYVNALDLQKRYAALPAEKQDPRMKAFIDSSITMAGSAEIMGKPLAESGLKASRSTRIQHIVDTLYAQVAYDDFSVDVSDQPGMKGSINFADPDAVRTAFVADKAMRIRLGITNARTIEEEENKKLHDKWPGVPYHMRLMTDQVVNNLSDPVGYGTTIDYDVSFALAASDNIRSELGKKSLRPPLTLLNVLGVSSKQQTPQALRDHITRDALELFEGEKGILGKRAAMSRDVRLEKYLETSAFVFTRDHPHARQCMSLFNDANRLKGDLGDVVAVLLEGKSLQSGTTHFAVLGTFVFRDPKTKEMTVAQIANVGGSVAGISGSIVTSGTFTFPDIRTLQMKPGIDVLLQNISTAEVEREEGDTREREALKKKVQVRMDQWRQAAPVRADESDARTTERQKALERAKMGTEMMYVPGELTVDDRLGIVSDTGGDFRSMFNGLEVTTNVPAYPEPPTIRANNQTSGVLSPETWDFSRFTASKDGKDYPYEVSFTNLKHFEAADQVLIRDVLTKRIDVTGHPKAKDEGFLKHVRRHEIERLTKMATYSSSWDKYAEEVRSKFTVEMVRLYEKCLDSKRQAFLSTLFDMLSRSPQAPIYNGRFFDHTYDTLVKDMKAFVESAQ